MVSVRNLNGLQLIKLGLGGVERRALTTSKVISGLLGCIHTCLQCRLHHLLSLSQMDAIGSFVTLGLVWFGFTLHITKQTKKQNNSWGMCRAENDLIKNEHKFLPIECVSQICVSKFSDHTAFLQRYSSILRVGWGLRPLGSVWLLCSHLPKELHWLRKHTRVLFKLSRCETVKAPLEHCIRLQTVDTDTRYTLDTDLSYRIITILYETNRCRIICKLQTLILRGKLKAGLTVGLEYTGASQNIRISWETLCPAHLSIFLAATQLSQLSS